MKLFKLSAVAAALVSVSAFAAPTITSNIELDNYSITGSGLQQAGRVETNLTSKMGADAFVAAKAAVLAKKDGTVAVDDMWIQLGNSAVNAKLGRFEAADLFPLGKDVIVAKSNSALGYNAGNLRGRKGSSEFHGTLGFNLNPMLSAEVGVIEHKGSTADAKGLRPVVTANFGTFKISAGIESVKASTGNYTGTGLTARYNLDGGHINASIANAKISNVKSNSFGLNGTFGPFGLGLIQDKSAATKGTTVYAAYTVANLFGVSGANMTPAVSSSKATGKSNVTGVNLRFNYGF